MGICFDIVLSGWWRRGEKTNGRKEEDMGERQRKGLGRCRERGEGGKEEGWSLTRRLKMHIGNEDDVCGQL